jgi:acetylglutamate kinase
MAQPNSAPQRVQVLIAAPGRWSVFELAKPWRSKVKDRTVKYIKSQYNAHRLRLVCRKISQNFFSGPFMNAQLASPPTEDQNNDLTKVAPQIKAAILAEALPYIRNFHGKTIVIKYGGNAMTDERLKHGFARDVILLKLVGMNPVVVHGGGPQIDNALKKIGKQGTFVQGMRITDEETMEVVEWVLGGEVQQDIVMLINHYGGQAVGLTGKDGGLIRARRMAMPDKEKPGEFLDIGFVGEIEAINPAVVKALQDDAFIPIISPIGFGQDGQAYNINADVVAGKIAEILKAEKLIMMTNIAGVQDKNGNLVTDLSAREIDEMFEDGTISGGMLPKISSALDAAKSGVNTVHIIDGRIEHSLLLEVLTEQAFGTMIRSH